MLKHIAKSDKKRDVLRTLYKSNKLFMHAWKTIQYDLWFEISNNLFHFFPVPSCSTILEMDVLTNDCTWIDV